MRRRGVGSGGDAADPAWTAVDDYIEHHLIRADPVTKTISLLSFPRDLEVPIYCSATPYARPFGKVFLP